MGVQDGPRPYFVGEEFYVDAWGSLGSPRLPLMGSFKRYIDIGIDIDVYIIYIYTQTWMLRGAY